MSERYAIYFGEVHDMSDPCNPKATPIVCDNLKEALLEFFGAMDDPRNKRAWLLFERRESQL